MFTINETIRIPWEELQFTYVRSSGPGGQNVNKVASKAVLRWTPGENETLAPEVLKRFQKLFPAHCTKENEVLITSQKTRDAIKNRDDCLEKLREMLLRAVKVPKPRIPTRRTRASIKRRLENKTKNARKKQGRRKIDPDFKE